MFSGYWFEIVYRPGKQNSKADCLSRIQEPGEEEKEPEKDSILKPEQLVDFKEDEEECIVIIESGFVEDIKREYKHDQLAQEILRDLNNTELTNSYNHKHWVLVGDLIANKNNRDQIYIPEKLRKTVIQLNHDSEYARHLGVMKTLDLVSRNYCWPMMRKDIAGYIRSCVICQTMKNSHHAAYGTAVRVPPSELPWQEVQIDFIMDLPVKNHGWREVLAETEELIKKTGCIMVCNDRLTKMIHLVGFRHVPTAKETAVAYLQNIFKLHGFPKEITTD